MKSGSNKFLPFEGLRGISALAVVFCHLGIVLAGNPAEMVKAWFAGWPTLLAVPAERLILAFCAGSVAVWIFWVMSGYVLSLRFFQTAKTAPSEASKYLEDAALRRYPRLLLPVLISVMAAYLLWLAGWNHIANYKDLLHGNVNPILHPSFGDAVRSAVWDTFFRYSDDLTYDRPLWTMGKELIGSFFLFAFLALLGNRRSRFLAYPVLAVICALCGYLWLDSFLLGIAICDLAVLRERWMPLVPRKAFQITALACQSSAFAWVVWVFVLIGISIAPITWRYSVEYGDMGNLIAGTVAVLVTLFSLPTQRFLSRRAPVYLGRISFSLYLIHTPILCTIVPWLNHTLRRAGLGEHSVSILICTCSVGLSLAAGELVYHIADKPSVELSRKISRGLQQWLNQLATRFGAPAQNSRAAAAAECVASPTR